MNILAIETTSAFASIAVLNERGECTEVVSDGSLNHLQRLLPMVEDALKKSGGSLNDITGLAVSRGPGSFTGIRIGVTTAKALAQVLGVKIAQVPTLFAMAYTLKDRNAVICPILDARRNQVYSAAYLFENGSRKEIFPEGAYSLEEVVAFLEPYESVLFMGDGVEPFGERLAEQMGSRCEFVPLAERMQRASSIARIGLEMHRAGDVADYVTAEPEYLRKSEAERNLERKLRETS